MGGQGQRENMLVCHIFSPETALMAAVEEEEEEEPCVDFESPPSALMVALEVAPSVGVDCESSPSAPVLGRERERDDTRLILVADG